MLDEDEDIRDGEFENFDDTNSEYKYTMSPESNIEQTQTTELCVQPCGSSSELLVSMQGLSEEVDIVVNGDKFASNRDDDEGIGQSAWHVFNQAHVFNPVFDVGMIFTNKKVMKATIKSRAIAHRRSVKLTKND